MHDHAPLPVERRADVAIVGGSAAGLAAARQLVRQGRSVIVIDGGGPPNETTDNLHGYPGYEGVPALTLLAEAREEVRRDGGEVLAGQASRVIREDEGQFRVELVGGHAIVARRVLAAAGLADELPPIDGLALEGVYAVGSVTDSGHQVLQAAAQGSRVGAMISVDLADDDLRAPARPSANEADWDRRYSGDQLWSGNPNGTLMKEVRGVAPGRVLDVGAGEGGDAIWLAQQGWRVTASDISGRALERVDAEARRRDLRVECRQADANALDPFEPGGFDLVSAQYASIPRTADDRAVHNLLRAVAPNGLLLVVSHDLARRAPSDAPGQGRPFDPDAYVRVDDFVLALADAPDWEIEVHETRPRPPGAASASHHVDDVVLRARRHAR